VGNHNFSDISLDSGVQKGVKPFSFEVEARSNVLNNFVVRVIGSEVSNLSVQISFLGVGRDSAVAIIFFWDSILTPFWDLGEDIGEEETSVVTFGTDTPDFSSTLPHFKGSHGDFKDFTRFNRTNVFVVRIHNLK
jgi:hypothetical protein